MNANAQNPNSMEANIRRMNAVNAKKSEMIGGPKMIGEF